MEKRLIAENPVIYTVDDILTPEECRAIIKKATPHMKVAGVSAMPGQKGFEKGRALLESAQAILTSDELSIQSDRDDEDSALGGVYHLLGLLDMFEWFKSKDVAKLDSAIV